MPIDSLKDGDCGSDILGAELEGANPPGVGLSLGMVGFAFSPLGADLMRALLFQRKHFRLLVV
jgi:hypothetical protein